jgi:hypothetical protein
MLRASRWLDEADALPLTYSFELADRLSTFD